MPKYGSEFTKTIMLSLTKDSINWLNQKASLGYKKGTILRLILTDYINADMERAETIAWPEQVK